MLSNHNMKNIKTVHRLENDWTGGLTSLGSLLWKNGPGPTCPAILPSCPILGLNWLLLYSNRCLLASPWLSLRKIFYYTIDIWDCRHLLSYTSFRTDSHLYSLSNNVLFSTLYSMPQSAKRGTKHGAVIRCRSSLVHLNFTVPHMCSRHFNSATTLPPSKHLFHQTELP